MLPLQLASIPLMLRGVLRGSLSLQENVGSCSLAWAHVCDAQRRPSIKVRLCARGSYLVLGARQAAA